MGVSAFRRWLAGHDSDEIVGLANNPKCPIAKYVSDQWGEPLAFYGQHFELPTGEHYDIKVQPWMQTFVAMLDGGHYGKVTAAQALVVLREMQEWAKPLPTPDQLPSMQELLSRQSPSTDLRRKPE